MLSTRKSSRMDSNCESELQAAAWVGGMGNQTETGLAGHPIRRQSKSEQKPAAIFSTSCAYLSAPLRFLHQVVSGFAFLPFKNNWAQMPSLRLATLTTTTALLFFTGCVSAHKKGRTIHERFDYQIVQPTGGDPVAVLKCHEIWEDEWTGGGRAFLADPKASELVSIHTNQIALGGSSSLSIGSFQSDVSTNGIIASGQALSQIIQGIGAAVGQAANKTVTGTPLKP